jgi:quercetin dioxygenase-like cupin family protein
MSVKLKVHGKDWKEREDEKFSGMPKIEVVDLDDVYIRSMYFEKTGESNRPHRHTFDHYTLLAAGSCIAQLDEETNSYVAPAIIFTPAGTLHKFTATEPNTALHCINVLHDGEPIIV